MSARFFCGCNKAAEAIKVFLSVGGNVSKNLIESLLTLNALVAAKLTVFETPSPKPPNPISPTISIKTS